MVSGKIAQALEQSIGRELDKGVVKTVQVGFKRLTEDAVIPTKAHASDSGYDLVASEDVIIEPGETVVVPIGIAVQLPEGYEATVRPRSGVTSKTKLRVALGTIDNGYTSGIGVIVDNIHVSKLNYETTEYLLLDNTSVRTETIEVYAGKSYSGRHYYEQSPRKVADGTYLILKGERIAQLVITRLPAVESVEVFDVGESDRGARGFGSSGVRTQLISGSITDNHELLSKLGDE